VITDARCRRWRLVRLTGPCGVFSAAVEAITADAVRRYQLHRREQGAEAATINRETSALSRMFPLAIRRGLRERID
jgi:site-specific recombinase XerD